MVNLEHLTSREDKSSSLRSSSSLASPYATQPYQTPTMRQGSNLPTLLDREHRSANLLDLIYSLVPEEMAGRRLSSLYLMGPYHDGWHVCSSFHLKYECLLTLCCEQVLHGPSFGAELKMFYSLDPARRRAETDPAWLAIYLMVSLHHC